MLRGAVNMLDMIVRLLGVGVCAFVIWRAFATNIVSNNLYASLT